MRGPARGRTVIGKAVTVAALLGVLGAMATLVAFSVPLYRLFCAATGYEGTTERAAVAPSRITDRVVTVRFDTNVAPGLPWRFRPLQSAVTVHLGEDRLVFFSAENMSGETIVGHATFNVMPARVGTYFNKLQCFCFSEERLEPHAKVDMPVDFFVAPEFASDPNTRYLDSITLSYTFFRSRDPAGAKDLSRFTAPSHADPQRGQQLFAERCAACHALDRHRIGPMLGGVVGRPAGAATGYDYSPALRQSGIRWTAETLNRWLEGPQSFVPGAKMPVHVDDATMRRDIIAYLQAQSRGGAARRQTASTP